MFLGFENINYVLKNKIACNFRFESHSAAEAALKRLHQTEVLGQLLAAEFARGENVHDFSSGINGNQDEKR